MIVLDASAAIELLLNTPSGHRVAECIATPATLFKLAAATLFELGRPAMP